MPATVDAPPQLDVERHNIIPNAYITKKKKHTYRFEEVKIYHDEFKLSFLKLGWRPPKNKNKKIKN